MHYACLGNFILQNHFTLWVLRLNIEGIYQPGIAQTIHGKTMVKHIIYKLCCCCFSKIDIKLL